MKVTVEATVALEDVLSECALSDVLDALDMDEVLNEIDSDTMVSFVVSNHTSKVLEDMDDYEVIRHVSRTISMGSLVEDLDDDDKAELRRVLAEEDEPDQPKLTTDQWELVKQGLKAIIAMRNLIGASQGAYARTLQEQAIVDLINEHLPS